MNIWNIFAPTTLKAKNPDNLSFEVADATSLRFADNFKFLISVLRFSLIP